MAWTTSAIPLKMARNQDLALDFPNREATGFLYTLSASSGWFRRIKQFAIRTEQTEK
jgi:hypothetical protein